MRALPPSPRSTYFEQPDPPLSLARDAVRSLLRPHFNRCVSGRLLPYLSGNSVACSARGKLDVAPTIDPAERARSTVPLEFSCSTIPVSTGVCTITLEGAPL